MRSKYFVLDPESKGPEDKQAEASRKAMIAYASVIFSTDPILSNALTSWVEAEDRAHVFKWGKLS